MSSAWLRRGSRQKRGAAGAGTVWGSPLQESMKASKESWLRRVRWVTFPPRPRARGCRVWLPGSLTPRGLPVEFAAAPPPVCLRLREVPGSPGGRRPRDLQLRVGGVRPHTWCPESVPQVPHQAGPRPMPRRLRVPRRSAGRHSALTAGPLPCQAPPFVLAPVSVVGAPALLARPRWAPRAAVGSSVQAVWLHHSSIVVPLGRGLPPRAAARVGFPSPRVVGRPPGRQCVPDPGQGPCCGLRDREMTALPIARAARSVGRGAAGVLFRRASWPGDPLCRTLPEPGWLGPRWARGCRGARCRRAGRRWCWLRQRCVPVRGGRLVVCMLGPPPAGQVCHGVGGVRGEPVLLPLGRLPAVDRVQVQRVV